MLEQWVSLYNKHPSSSPPQTIPSRSLSLLPRNQLILAPFGPTTRIPRPKTNRPQLPPPTTPHAPENHQRRARSLQRPPQPIRRQRSRIQGRDNEVINVDGQGEIGHESAARDEQKQQDDPTHNRQPRPLSQICPHPPRGISVGGG